MKKQVIKIQVPVNKGIVNPMALFYNRDRSMMFQMEITKNIQDLMGDSPKKYFEMTIDGKGEPHIGKEVPNPGW